MLKPRNLDGGERQKVFFLKLGLHSKETNPRLEGGKRSCCMAQGHSGIHLRLPTAGHGLFLQRSALTTRLTKPWSPLGLSSFTGHWGVYQLHRIFKRV